MSTKSDTASYSVYRDYVIPLLPITLEREQKGLRVNQDLVNEMTPVYEQRVKEAEQLAQAYVGWPINLNSPGKTGQLATWLQKVDNIKLKSINQDDIAPERNKWLGVDVEEERRTRVDTTYICNRIEEGAHALLECRVLFARSLQVLNKYLLKCRGRKRVYPEFHLHTQRNARWSTVEPPLAQLPEDLRTIVIPDDGMVWIGWDWAAIEPRILMAESSSQVLKEAFEQGIDIHTRLACWLFDLPQPPLLTEELHKSPVCDQWRKQVGWEGKEDKRRVFAKQAKYEVWYGGTGSNAVKRASRMGLARDKAKQVYNLIMAEDPAYATWRHNHLERFRRTGETRTFSGRRRRFMDFTPRGNDSKLSERLQREALDYPMQAGVSDVFNMTQIQIKQAAPWATFAWQMHDSAWWEVPVERKDEFLGVVKPIIEQEWIINQQVVRFPASYKEQYHA